MSSEFPSEMIECVKSAYNQTFKIDGGSNWTGEATHILRALQSAGHLRAPAKVPSDADLLAVWRSIEYGGFVPRWLLIEFQRRGYLAELPTSDPLACDACGVPAMEGVRRFEARGGLHLHCDDCAETWSVAELPTSAAGASTGETVVSVAPSPAADSLLWPPARGPYDGLPMPEKGYWCNGGQHHVQILWTVEGIGYCAAHPPAGYQLRSSPPAQDPREQELAELRTEVARLRADILGAQMTLAADLGMKPPFIEVNFVAARASGKLAGLLSRAESAETECARLKETARDGRGESGFDDLIRQSVLERRAELVDLVKLERTWESKPMAIVAKAVELQRAIDAAISERAKEAGK